MALNIASLALKKDTFPLHLRHPVTDEPLYDEDENGKADESKPVRIHLYGTASKEYRDVIRGIQNRALKRGKDKKASAAEVQEESLTLLLAVSDSADNLELPDGTPVGSPASFRKLYEDASYSWLRDQVDAAVGDVANFLAQ